MLTKQQLDLPTSRMINIRKTIKGIWHKPRRQNLALTFIPFCFLRAAKSGWPTCHNTHSFFLKTSGLVVSEFFCQVPEHQGKISKRTDVYSVLQREQQSKYRQPASQDLRQYLVFQLFGRGESTLGVIVLMHSGGSRPDLLCPAWQTCVLASPRPSLPLHLKT